MVAEPNDELQRTLFPKRSTTQPNPTVRCNFELEEDLFVDVTIIAAVIYSLTTLVVVTFQLALALGAPWGAYAMGGAFPGRFPPRVRLAAVAQTMLLGLMAVVVLSGAGLMLPQWSQASVWPTWAIVAFGAIGVVLNTITPSAEERRLWASGDARAGCQQPHGSAYWGAHRGVMAAASRREPRQLTVRPTSAST